jgi:hypothetical protein
VQCRRRLRVGGHAFALWCERNDVDLREQLHDVHLINLALISFLQSLFAADGHFWIATHIVLTVQVLFRHLRGNLRPAWDSIQSWQLRRAPSMSRIPATRFVMSLLSCPALEFAFVWDKPRRRRWIAFSVASRAGWNLLLTPIEIFGLHKKHIRLPDSPLQGSVGVLTVINPKNHNCLGRVQSSALRCRTTICWLL